MKSSTLHIEQALDKLHLFLPEKTAIELGIEAYQLFLEHAASFEHQEHLLKTEMMAPAYIPTLYFLAIPKTLERSLEWYALDLSVDSNFRLKNYIWISALQCQNPTKSFYKELGRKILSLAGEFHTPIAIQISKF